VDRVGFEKWLAENYCDHESREKYHALEGYKMRQPEIDALREELSASLRSERLLKVENAALKAEAEKWKRLLEDHAVSKYNFETTVERETMKEPK
jgi:hypothetical protein